MASGANTAGRREVLGMTTSCATSWPHDLAANVSSGRERFYYLDAPKLSCVIPEVRHRFECLVGASAPFGVSPAIRAKHPFIPTWDQVGTDPEIVEYLKVAMDGQANMIISGATNTGDVVKRSAA